MPNKEAVDRALETIAKGRAQYEYFFDRLSSPTWMEPLFQKGLFKHPQKAEQVDGYIRFPFWPESRYLARMAAIPEAQATVLQISLAIPSTDNSRVYDDLTEIALSLPPASSAKLVPKILEGLRLPVKLLLKDRIGGLIVHLAEGAEGAAARTLAQGALALAPDENAENSEQETLHFPKPQPLLEDFYYQRAVATGVPALVAATGFEAVRMFADLLDQAIRLSQKRGDDGVGTEDFLYVAHPAIEVASGRDDVPGILLYAVRDAAEQFLRGNPGELSRVLDLLKTKRWVSFERLRLHLCREFLDAGGLAIAERMFEDDPEILNRGSLQHEAVLLLNNAFPYWQPAAQGRLLEWMERGLSEDDIRRRLEFFGQEVTPESVQQIGEIWKRDHFAILKDHLSDWYQKNLSELTAKVGPPRDLGEARMSSSGGAFSPLSPKSPGEFGSMGVTEIIEFLVTWTPGGELFGATAEGAGRDLGAAITERLGDFVAAAEQFKRLDPTYVRSFFGSLTTALKEKLEFDWAPVLDLAAWVSSQPREMPGRKGGLFVADPDWGWSRDSIIDLLSAGFNRDLKGHLPLHLREKVWSVLRPLTDDPNPTLSAETPDPEKSASPVLSRFSQRDERAREPDLTSISINSTRGRAMHAVFQYARWVRLCSDAQRASSEEVSITLAAMSEVREVLDAHLEVTREPTRTVRSVYGDHLTLLAWLDWPWLEANLERILPLAEADYPFFSAAWRSFIVFNQPHITLLKGMAPCYRKAIEHLGKDILPRHSVKSPEASLAEHLMVYYWLGSLDLNGEDGLLDEFYDHASDHVRGHATWFVGVSVAGWQDDVPSEVFPRLQTLFEKRLLKATNAQTADGFTSELANFGHWFTSEKFDDNWSIHQLLAALRISKKVLPEMDVMTRLSELCPRYPVECVACLRLIIEGDKEGWILLGVENDARELLRHALASNHPEGILSAKRLVEELIAKGHFGFRSLLA